MDLIDVSVSEIPLVEEQDIWWWGHTMSRLSTRAPTLKGLEIVEE